MRKIAISLTLVVILLFGIVAVNASQKDPSSAGAWIGSALRDILSSNERTLDSSESPDRIVGTILGEEIEAKDLEVRAKLFELAGSDNPLEDAWDSMKVQAYEKQFAEEHNIYPTEKEIIEFTEKQRALVESTPDGKAYSKAVIEAAGMTEDEYWNDYKIRKESPAHLTSIKVAEYLETNNLPELDKEKIKEKVKAEITDEK